MACSLPLAARMEPTPFISVVVPVFNEEANAPVLVQAVRDALAAAGTWELILVDDGSSDQTREVIGALVAADARVRLIPLARNYGQSTAMQAGFDHARGEIVVSMDGDLQNDPRDIPRLVAKLAEGYDLVAGYRVRRRDKLVTRKVPSWVANRLIRWVTGVAIRDNGCSLKAYRHELLERMRLYSDMHRFIPALAAAVAAARITELPVQHHPRLHGSSKYGLSRILKVAADLLTVKMIRSFRDRPLWMFGLAAAGATALGVAFALASVVAMVWFRPVKAHALVFPGAAMLWFGLGCYLLILGLVSESVVSARETLEPEQPPLLREERR